MCAALEELKNECKQEGIQEGIQEGKIAGFIEASKEFGVPREKVEKRVLENYGLKVEEAKAYMEQYW